MKKRKRSSDAEVADYWLQHDSAAEVDWSRRSVRIEFDPEVERPTRSVTLRLPRRLRPRENATSAARAIHGARTSAPASRDRSPSVRGSQRLAVMRATPVLGRECPVGRHFPVVSLRR